MNKKSVLYLSICLFTLTLLFNPAICKLPSADIGFHEPSEWNWYMTNTVTPYLAGHSTNPTVTTDINGARHVVWVDKSDYMGSGTDDDIFYTSGYHNAWNEIEVVSSTSASAGSTFPDIAVDDELNVHVAWQDMENYNSSGTDYDIFYRYKNTTSGAWSTTIVVSDICTFDSVNVSIAVDDFGFVHFAWVDSTDIYLAGNDWDIFYRKYNFFTNTWYPIIVITPDSTGVSNDPCINISPSKDIEGFREVNIFWSDEAVSGEVISFPNIYCRTWTDLGGWEQEELISWESIYSSLMPAAYTGPTGNIHVVWFDQNDGSDYEIFYKRYDMKENNWTNVESVSLYMSQSSGRCPPSICVDSADNVHVAWIEGGEYANNGVDDDVLYRRLYTEINTWTTIEAVAKATESTEMSSNPSISIDPIGNIIIVWDDFTDWDLENDYDIFERGFGRAPDAPVLEVYWPTPGHTTDTGVVELMWNLVPSASEYTIYRSNEFIHDVFSINTIQLDYTQGNYFMDNLATEGIYYYAIKSYNAHGYTMSNVVYVEYITPHLDEFTLAFLIIGGSAVIIILISKKRRYKR